MKPCVRDSLPLDRFDIAKLIRRVGSANSAIARYDELSKSVVNSSAMFIATDPTRRGLAISELVNQAEGRKVL